MFQKIETDEALVVERGVYKVVGVYQGPDQGLYVKIKGGFVRLRHDGSTSHDAVKLKTLCREGEIWHDQHGRLTVQGGGKRTLLQGNAYHRLVAPPGIE